MNFPRRNESDIYQSVLFFSYDFFPEFSFNKNHIPESYTLIYVKRVQNIIISKVD